PGADASRLRSAAAVRLERGAVIVSIAVTRARRLIAPRPTSVIVAIAATWGWLTRAMLPGHRDPPISPFAKRERDCIPPSQGGNLSFTPRFGEDQRDLGATQQAPRRRGGRSGQGQLYSMPARGWRRSCSQRRPTSGQIRQVQPALVAELHEPAVSLGDAVVQTRPRERAQPLLEPRIVQVEGMGSCRSPCVTSAVEVGTTSPRAATKVSMRLTAPRRLKASAPWNGCSSARTKVAATSPTYCRSCKPP